MKNSGYEAWNRVILTSAGWEDDFRRVKEGIRRRFLEMLEKPPEKAKVLFVTTAAISDEARRMVLKSRDELIGAGLVSDNILEYDMDGHIALDEAMEHDVVYFTGGNTGWLLRRVKETGFDRIVKSMVYANKVYVGASAGSIIAARDISTATLTDMAPELDALSLVDAFISVHCQEGTAARTDLPLPHIPLTDNQALAVSSTGYEIVDG